MRLLCAGPPAGRQAAEATWPVGIDAPTLTRMAGPLVVAALVAAAPALAGPPPPSAPLVVSVSGSGAILLAGWDSRTPVGEAVEPLGRPAISRASADTCLARWAPIGLAVTLYNLGGLDPCTLRGGLAGTARASGARWRTARGLGIGDPLERLRRLYPGARRSGAIWSLLRDFDQARGAFTPLSAEVRNGRVRALRALIGAGGE
jgi:hypothetical protein